MGLKPGANNGSRRHGGTMYSDIYVQNINFNQIRKSKWFGNPPRLLAEDVSSNLKFIPMKITNLITFFLLFLALTNCSGQTSKEGGSTFLLIRNATIIDGKGNEAVRNMDILIENNRIIKIGKAIDKPSEAVEIDATGLTVLPGLIDSHVHISSVPGSGFRNDSLTLYENLQRHHLKAYLACGVTTILDTGIPPEEARKINGWLVNGQPGPRLLVLSPAFTAPKGYLSNPDLGRLFFRPVTSSNDVINQLNETADLKAKGVKVFIESGFGMGRLPILSDEIRKTITEQCNLRNLPLYIHGSVNIALDMEPHALVHGAAVGNEEVIARIKEKPVYMISTLSIQDGFTIEFDRNRLSDPFYLNTVPEIELQTANDEAAWRNFSLSFAKMVLTETATKEEIENLTQPGNPQAALAAWMDNIKKQHAAGIPIVMGSDAGNWPVMPQMFHGPTSVREVELLVLAGMTPLEAIKSSTSIPSEMLEMTNDIGTIEEGKVADIIIVEGNPINDIKALKNIKWTIKNGVAKTPKQWME